MKTPNIKTLAALAKKALASPNKWPQEMEVHAETILAIAKQQERLVEAAKNVLESRDNSFGCHECGGPMEKGAGKHDVDCSLGRLEAALAGALEDEK